MFPPKYWPQFSYNVKIIIHRTTYAKVLREYHNVSLFSPCSHRIALLSSVYTSHVSIIKMWSSYLACEIHCLNPFVPKMFYLYLREIPRSVLHSSFCATCISIMTWVEETYHPFMHRVPFIVWYKLLQKSCCNLHRIENTSNKFQHPPTCFRC